MQTCGAEKVLNLETINKRIISMSYELESRVLAAVKEITTSMEDYPFDEVLYLNYGNPQGIGQKPISWYREVLALVNARHLLQDPNVSKVFDEDVIAKANEVVEGICHGLGAYSAGEGALYARTKVKEFLERRDGHPADLSSIFMTYGATTAIEAVLGMIIDSESTGVFVPVPQYPVFNAFIDVLGGVPLNYYLDEDKEWALDMQQIRDSLKQAKVKGIVPKAFIVINPGNPTGALFSYEELQELVKFCKEEGLVLLADEVYQDNVYDDKYQFHSIKKVVRDLGPDFDDFEFVSFHSTSKGLTGECGRRGGYMEVCGLTKDVLSNLDKAQQIKICPNLDGQLLMSLMVDPPKASGPSFKLFQQEVSAIKDKLKRNAELVYEEANNCENMSCQPIKGAMYAFIKLELPEKAVEEARGQDQAPDVFYSLSLLKARGICVTPGDSFCQKEGTHHVRLSILPSYDVLKEAMEKFKQHHLSFIGKYSS